MKKSSLWLSGSLRKSRSEEITQSTTSSSRGNKVSFESQSGRWLLKSPKMKRFLEAGSTEGKRSRIYYLPKKSA